MWHWFWHWQVGLGHWYHDTVNKSGTPTHWYTMTLSAKLAHPQAGMPRHYWQKWHTLLSEFSFFIFFIRYKYILYWCLHFCPSQPPRQKNCTLHVCQVHSYLYTDSLTRTSYMTVFAWISPLMWRLLLFELVSGVMLIFRLIHLLRTYSFIMSFFITIVISMGLFAQLWIEGSRLLAPPPSSLWTLSPTSFLTLDSKPHLLPRFGLKAPPPSSLWTPSPICFLTLGSKPKPHLFPHIGL